MTILGCAALSNHKGRAPPTKVRPPQALDVLMSGSGYGFPASVSLVSRHMGHRRGTAPCHIRRDGELARRCRVQRVALEQGAPPCIVALAFACWPVISHAADSLRLAVGSPSISVTFAPRCLKVKVRQGFQLVIFT
jgi:hypothetical protein